MADYRKKTYSFDGIGGRVCASLLAAAVLLGCSKGAAVSNVACSSTKSLLRWDPEKVPVTSAALTPFLSNGGFIEVFTRSDILGKIDKTRLCSAYVEFNENPADVPGDLANQPVQMNVFTATHCLDLSKDHDIKVHVFNGNIYRDFWVDFKALESVKKLRSAMRIKGVPAEARRKVLETMRSPITNLDELFNANSISSSSTGTGGSLKAAETCLKKNDPDWQHVCATYQDLSVIQVAPSKDTPAVVIDELKQLRTVAVERASKWIAESKIYAELSKTPPLQVSFPDEPGKYLDVKTLHAELRKRIRAYSKFKTVQYLADELGAEIKRCVAGEALPVCKVNSEIAAVLKSVLEGTGYEIFEDSKLTRTLDAFKSGYANAQARMDRSFDVVIPFIQAGDGTSKLNLKARVHSNFKFTSAGESPIDNPDPKDSLSTGRVFANINVNNLTADNTGGSVAYVRWANSSGRFNYFKMPKKVTDAVRNNFATSGMPYHFGFMQAGDSGSVVVFDHMPMFAISSVDGEATSGGSALRPLPEPMDEDDLEELKGGSVMKKSSAGCR